MVRAGGRAERGVRTESARAGSETGDRDGDEGGGGGENQSDEDERGRGARVVGRESGADGLLNGGWVEARDRHRTYGE